MKPLERASTYAAGSPTSVVSSDVKVATLKLFHALWSRPFSVRAMR